MASMNEFKFKLGEEVEIWLSGNIGKVVSRAEHARHPNSYNLHHLDGAGDAVYSWFDEQDLLKIEE